MPGFSVSAEGVIRLPFEKGISEKLAEAMQGRNEATIDLRNNVEGDFDAMLACLKVVAPNGTYGYLVTQKPEKPWPLTLSDSTAKRIKLTLLVDKTTRGVAEIFALSLSTRGIAKLNGTEMAGNQYVVGLMANENLGRLLRFDAPGELLNVWDAPGLAVAVAPGGDIAYVLQLDGATVSRFNLPVP